MHIHVASSNEGMTLSEFKRIFYMEYAHRMWGRSIGAVFFLPAVFFTYKGWVSKSLRPRLFIYGGLLAFQVILEITRLDQPSLREQRVVCGSINRKTEPIIAGPFYSLDFSPQHQLSFVIC